MRKHYVEFISPGTFMAETTTKEIASWDIREAAHMCKDIKERYNATPYAFRFKTFLVADDIPDGEGGWIKTVPNEVASSGSYFIDMTGKAKVRSYDEVVADNNDKERILRDNMCCNRMWFVVDTYNSFRSTNEFGENDLLVDALGNMIAHGDNPKRID